MRKYTGQKAVDEAQKVAKMFKTTKEVISKFEFRGIIADMHQRNEGSTQCNEPHTKFTFLTKLLEQDKFQEIIEKIALGGHCADIHIVVKTLQTTEEKEGSLK